MATALDTILDDLGAGSDWCEDCSHPVCLSNKQSFKTAILKLISEGMDGVIGEDQDPEMGDSYFSEARQLGNNIRSQQRARKEAWLKEIGNG